MKWAFILEYTVNMLFQRDIYTISNKYQNCIYYWLLFKNILIYTWNFWLVEYCFM